MNKSQTKINYHVYYWDEIYNVIHICEKKFINDIISSKFEIIQIFWNIIKSNVNYRKYQI